MQLANHLKSKATTFLPQPGNRRRSIVTSLPLLVVSAVAACSSAPPEFEAIADQTGQVGVELKIDVRAIDPDGDRLTYKFKSDHPDLADRASIARTPTDTAIFRWTPNAADIGTWNFDFVASDGDSDVTVTVPIEIRSSIGAASAPLFRRPDGSGQVVDLTQASCVTVDLVVEDQDTAQVDITQREPLVEGGELIQLDGTSAQWKWCPTPAQVEAESRYTLTFAADDNDNAPTLKDYLIVLRGELRPDCPGDGPLIGHTASGENTIQSLKIAADISDDKGLKQAPLLYYSQTQPLTPPNLALMTQVTMRLDSGTMADGTWTAWVPNPVFDQAAGVAKTLYYVIVARDDDDTTGSCDNETTSPVYSKRVTSNGAGNAELCEPCSGDVQCGGSDTCVRVGGMGEAHCLQSCATNACPSGYTCMTVTSVDGASSKQCAPNSGSCNSDVMSCMDDSYEENDSRTQASTMPVLAPELYDLVSCPRAGSSTLGDEDWFKLNVPASSRVVLDIAGNNVNDLDLGLYKEDGSIVSRSTSLSDDESISKCVPAGTYYARVNAYRTGRNAYLFDYRVTAETCSACVDDSQEDDDNRPQARHTGLGNPLVLPYSSTGDKICPNDPDWYFVRISNGETLKAEITFTQTSFDQDLDLHWYNAAGVDQTPCSITSSATCNAANGQSSDSNETMTQTVTTGCASGCDYYFAVEGYAGASAPYTITITKL